MPTYESIVGFFMSICKITHFLLGILKNILYICRNNLDMSNLTFADVMHLAAIGYIFVICEILILILLDKK